MVSWRGVAKKRREQEAGVGLAKCSLTVAVSQQSCPDGNLYLGRSDLTCLHGLDSERPSRGPSQPERDREEISSADSPSHHRVTNRFADTHRRESQSSFRTTSLRQSIFRFALRAMRASKVTTPDINRVRNGSRHFCGPALFALVFVTR